MQTTKQSLNCIWRKLSPVSSTALSCCYFGICVFDIRRELLGEGPEILSTAEVLRRDMDIAFWEKGNLRSELSGLEASKHETPIVLCPHTVRVHWPPGTLAFDNTQNIANQGNSTKLFCPHSQDWLNHCLCCSFSCLLHLPGGQAGITGLTQYSNYNSRSFWNDQLQFWVSIHDQDLPWVTKTLLLLGRLKTFRSFFPGTGGKGQPNFFNYAVSHFGVVYYAALLWP